MFKKFCSIFLACLCLFSCLPFSVFADDVNSVAVAVAPDENTIPALPDGSFTNDRYFCYYRADLDSIFLFVYDGDAVDKLTISTVGVGIKSLLNFHFKNDKYNSTSTYLEEYKLTSDGWTMTSTSTMGNDTYKGGYFSQRTLAPTAFWTTTDTYTGINDGSHIYYCSDPIYLIDNYDTPFFTKPRPLTLGEVVGESLQSLTQTIQSSVILLTSLGVGLMALLILVILLSTKFRAYLS